jgi:hypothetical protein
MWHLLFLFFRIRLASFLSVVVVASLHGSKIRDQCYDVIVAALHGGGRDSVDWMLGKITIAQPTRASSPGLDGQNESNPFVGINHQDHSYCKYLAKYHYYSCGSKGKQNPTLNKPFKTKILISK